MRIQETAGCNRQSSIIHLEFGLVTQMSAKGMYHYSRKYAR
jgi:hypothetical protein